MERFWGFRRLMQEAPAADRPAWSGFRSDRITRRAHLFYLLFAGQYQA